MSRKSMPGFIAVSLAIPFLILGCSAGSNNSMQSSNANSAATPASSPASAPNAASKAKLNVNTATGPELLATIPGMGNKMVHEFEEYRPYQSIQQFRKEIGKYVTPAQVAEYEKYIYVPVDENQSDAATLQQIPGLDATEGQALIAGRPYASREAFLTKLTTEISADELAIAKTYLVPR